MDILQLGSTGPQVELMQAGLNRAGFNLGKPDGIFGIQTFQSLQSFQLYHGLIADGVFGPVTYEVLYPYLAGYVVVQIRSGDTIFRLANMYKTTINAIKTANPGVDPYSLYIGQIITIPFSFPVVFTDISFTYEVLMICLDGLKKRYPFLLINNLGCSVMGRQLPCVSIGSGENEVFYNASHHANEWLTTPVLMKFLEDYSNSYIRNSTIFGVEAKEIFAKTTIYIAPMLNPDGVNLVTGQTKPGTYEYNLAYNMRILGIDFPNGWKANIRGTDLNLNYPAEWRKAREVKFSQGFTRPGPRDYVGPNPLSEPESQAVALFTLQHHFRLTLSYHSQGEVIYWKFLNFLPPQSFEIAKQFGDVSGYAVEETPLTSGYAGYKDWFIQTYNLPGYTIEIGRGVNPLPVSQFDKIYNDNIGILTLGAIL